MVEYDNHGKAMKQALKEKDKKSHAKSQRDRAEVNRERDFQWMFKQKHEETLKNKKD